MKDDFNSDIIEVTSKSPVIESNSRRKFVAGALGLGASLLAPSVFAQKWQAFDDKQPSGIQSNVRSNINNISTPQIKGKDNDFWNQPRVLRLKRSQRKETFDGVYWKDGSVYTPGYRQICWLMRDLSINQSVVMDIQLLNLLCAMQAWVSFYGFKKQFLLSSGYRSPKYNNSLEGAAKNSMHLYGKAADIIMPDLPVSYVGKLAQQYSAGGVGFYPSSGFIHIDTGTVRSWGRRK